MNKEGFKATFILLKNPQQRLNVVGLGDSSS
jgi:hypothetical protein